MDAADAEEPPLRGDALGPVEARSGDKRPGACATRGWFCARVYVCFCVCVCVCVCLSGCVCVCAVRQGKSLMGIYEWKPLAKRERLGLLVGLHRHSCA